MRIFLTLLFCCICFLLQTHAMAAQTLTVVNNLPKEKTNKLTQITVQFSEPMCALGTTEVDPATVPLRITSTATLPQGNFRWLDPSTIAYLFDTPIIGATEVTVTVAAGAKSLSGNSLKKPMTWTISTPPIHLTMSKNEENTLIPGDGLEVRANMPLDIESMKKNTHILVGKTKYSVDIEESSHYEQNDAHIYIYVITPQETLPIANKALLIFEKGITSPAGPIPAQEFKFHFFTHPFPKVAKWYTSQQYNQDNSLQPFTALNVQFNMPIKAKDLLSHITVTPPVTFRQESQPHPEYSTQYFQLVADWKPRTKYTVKISKQLKDIMGNQLSAPTTFTFTPNDYHTFFLLPDSFSLIPPTGKNGFEILTQNIAPIKLRVAAIDYSQKNVALIGTLLGLSGTTEYQKTFNTILASKEAQSSLIDTKKDTPNTLQTHVVNLDAITGKPITGSIALVEFQTPSYNSEYHEVSKATSYALIQKTDLGITTKMGEESSLAWVTSIENGGPKPDTTITIYTADGKEIWSGTTDNDGIAKFPGLSKLPSTAMWMLVSNGDDRVAFNPQRTVHGAYFRSHYSAYAPMQAHLLTQLPLYQPGQQVNFVLYTKEFTGPDWKSIPEGEEVKLTITDNRHQVVHSATGKVSAFGSMSGSFTLSDEASLGTYGVAVHYNGKSAHAQGFTVAEFRTPNFKVDLSAPAYTFTPISTNATESLKITSTYFTGAPLAESKFAATFTSEPHFFRPDILTGYQIGLSSGHPFSHPMRYSEVRPWRTPRTTIGTAEGTLDTTGQATIPLPNPTIQPGQPVSIMAEITVTDPSGLTTQGTTSYVGHPSNNYVGLRLPYYVQAGVPIEYTVKGATVDNKPLIGTPITLTLQRYEESNQKKTVWEKQHTLTDITGDKLTFSVEKAGRYTLTATVKDEQGRENITKTEIFTFGSGTGTASTRISEPLELVQNTDSYTHGETARIFIKNPLPEGTALITLERNGVRSHQLRQVTDQTTFIDVPIDSKDAPYIHVGISMVQGYTQALKQSGSTTNGQVPLIRYGSTLVKIQKASSTPKVTVTTDAAEYRPGGTVKVKVKVTDTPTNAAMELTLIAVDERVLRVAGNPDSYNLASSFGAMFPNYMALSEVRNNLLQLITNIAENTPKPSRKAMAAPAPMAKEALLLGTVAADSPESEAEGVNIRENFTPLVHWVSQATLDSNGEYETTFTLPDSLTSYTIVAVAADKENTFATNTTSVTARKPLQILSSVPQFMVGGDTLSARILIQNLGTTDGEVTVTAKGEGITLTQQPSQTVAVAAGKSSMVSFPVKADQLGMATMTFSATMGQEKDAMRISIPVLPPRPITTVATAGLLKQGEQTAVSLTLPKDIDPRSNLTVSFAPSPVIGLAVPAQELINYPWQCLEQRLSRASARVLRVREGKLLNLETASDDVQRIKETMKSVHKFQKYNGGFSLWPDVEQPTLYLTAYTLYVNKQTELLEISISKSAIDQALTYIKQQLGATAKDTSLSERAFALWVLSLYRPGEASPLLSKLIAEAEQSPYTNAPQLIASLLMANETLASARQKDTTRTKLINMLEQTMQVTPTQMFFSTPDANGYWHTMGSLLRDNAFALSALIQVKPDYPRLEGLANWVSQGVHERTVLSTQEAIFTLRSLADYLRHLGGEKATKIKATLNNDTVTKHFAKITDQPETWVLPADKLSGLNNTKLALQAEEGTPFWTARLRYTAPGMPVKPENAGFTITHEWDTTKQWHVGDIVDMKVTITVPALRRHVLVVAPFPAGLEPLYASRVDRQTDQAGRNANYYWQRQEYHNDCLTLYTWSLHPGVYTHSYKLRVTTPGTFTLRPAYVEEMYTPEVFGRTSDSTVTVHQ